MFLYFPLNVTFAFNRKGFYQWAEEYANYSIDGKLFLPKWKRKEAAQSREYHTCCCISGPLWTEIYRL